MELALRWVESGPVVHRGISSDGMARGNRDALVRERGAGERDVRRARRSWGDGECIVKSGELTMVEVGDAVGGEDSRRE